MDLPVLPFNHVPTFGREFQTWLLSTGVPVGEILWGPIAIVPQKVPTTACL